MPGGGAGSLSPIELDFLWEAYGTGEVPYPLELRSHGATMDERSELRRKTMAGLAGRGMIDRAGAIHPRLAAHLEVLGGAEVSVDSVHVDSLDSKAVLAVVGALDGIGLMALQDVEGLHLSEVPSDGLASAVVALLPPAERGKERSLTMPVDTLVAGAGADFMQRTGSPETDVDRKALARLHAQERLRGGQIAANVRDAAGVRTRSTVLSWFDTTSGRYMTRASAGADGREWITIAPVDTATLRQRVSEMVASVQSGREVLR